MRYRGTIFVDFHEEGKQDAEKQFMQIVLGLKNAFPGDLVKMPHGSEISLVEENLPTGDSLISRGAVVK